jgi:hypothetical protein
MELIADFPADYTVALEAAGSSGEAVVEFRAADGLARSPALVLHVVPPSPGRGWFGEFFGERDGENAVAHTAHPRRLLAVAGGIPYLVPVDAPNDYAVIRTWSVRSVHPSVSYGLVILAGYSRLLAVDGAGRQVWESADLASDGLAEVRITSTVVVARGFWGPEGRDVETAVDIATGTIVDRF